MKWLLLVRMPNGVYMVDPEEFTSRKRAVARAVARRIAGADLILEAVAVRIVRKNFYRANISKGPDYIFASTEAFT